MTGETRSKSSGAGCVVGVLGMLALVFLSAALFVTAGGVSYVLDWFAAPQAELRAIGKRVTTIRRDCYFDSTRSGRTTFYNSTSAYVFELQGREVSCHAKHEACPCMDAKKAILSGLHEGRCEEQLTLLYDPADPARCRPESLVGLRSAGENDDLFKGLVSVGFGVALLGALAYGVHRLRRASKRNAQD